jgi:predicted transcriptional regulator
MSQIQFHQTNYIGKIEGRKEIKICPSCHTDFSPNIDECPNCKLFLPSFPTSWARSATNIFLLRKVLEYIFIELNGECNIENLSKILTKNYVISFDATRIDDEKYWKGGPMRRASEYLSNLQYLGFILKKNKTFKLTEKGNKLVLAKDYSEYITSLSEAFMNLKIGNEFDVNGFYSSYNNHILFQCLRIIDDLKNNQKQATIENLALAIMSKDEKLEYEKALNTSLKYEHQKIKELWFSRGKEFDRVVRGVFVRWLNQTKMINIENKEGTTFVSLTDFGKSIFEKYKEKYLLTPTILTSEDVKSLLEKSSLDKQYLRLSISSETTNRTGAVWETVVKENLNKLNLDVKWYKETQDFVNIKLPDEVLISLTGGTRHNPDLILHNPLWLIDPKKDVNAEMHKVFAYAKYGNIVNGLSVIVTQKMMRSEKVSMMKNLGLKNVLVLDGYALQVLSDNNKYFTKEKVMSIISKSPEKNIYYLNEELIFDNFVK